jgi:hypothetical protein
MSRSEAQATATAVSRRGTKQTCENDSCGRRFYDLNRATPVDCPYCGEAVTGAVVIRHEFETLGKRHKGKSYRLAAPEPVADEIAAEPELATEEPIPATDLLIETEDESEATTEDVIGHANDDET